MPSTTTQQGWLDMQRRQAMGVSVVAADHFARPIIIVTESPGSQIMCRPERIQKIRASVVPAAGGYHDVRFC